MKKTLMLAALAAFAAGVTGCSVTKVNYEKDDTGKVSYRLYRNDHWLKTNASGLRGGMTNDGNFEFSADGIEKSPSEEFNKMMATTMGTFAQMMQIAAAAYNPSSSAAAAALSANSTATPVTVNVAPAESNAAAAQPSESQTSQGSQESQTSQESK